MKHFSLLIIGLLIFPQLQSQELKTEPNLKKFHIGLDYTFIQTDMKLLYMTQQNTWNGTEFDLRKFEQDEIDEMNSIEKFTRKFQSLALEAGIVLVNKSDGKWMIDGSIMIGIAKPWYRVYNTKNDTIEFLATSGFSMLTAGFKFTFRYNLNPHWGFGLYPYFGYSFGTNKNINDNTYGHIEYFNEKRQNRYAYLYSRINVLASYTIKKFTVSAGPGFYLLYNANDYKLERSDPAGADTYLTEVETHLVSKYFIDGTIAIDWRIIDALTLSIYSAYATDLVIHGGIRYIF